MRTKSRFSFERRGTFRELSSPFPIASSSMGFTARAPFGRWGQPAQYQLYFTTKVPLFFISGNLKLGMICCINALAIAQGISEKRISHIIEAFEQKSACFIFYRRHVNAAITLWCHFAKIEKKLFFPIACVSYTPRLHNIMVFMARTPF